MRRLLSNKYSLAWLILAAGMVVSAVFLLIAGQHLTFSGDELYYYAHLTAQGTEPKHVSGVEYFLAPHNGHFVLLGRLIYEALFAIAGGHYVAFRIAEMAGIFVTVALLFRIASRSIDPLLALAPCVLLLFFGYAYETLLWPFDLHTVYALAFGLGAVLALERGDRRGDIVACVLLGCSVATVEVGLAFVAGFAVSILIRGDRWRRLWIVLVPAALYAVWWIWSRKFDQTAITLLNVHLISVDITNALAAVMGSMTGINETGAGIAPETTGISAWTAVLAASFVVALVIRLSRGSVPLSLWLVAATVVGYWITIALGGRPPDSARYLFVGAVLLLAVGAYALKGINIPLGALVAVAIVVVLAIPPNLAKFYDGRRLLLNDAAATRTEDAMLELSRGHVDPAYAPGADPQVAQIGGTTITAISAADYFRGVRDYGPLSYSLEQVRHEPAQFRAVADATLVDGLGLQLKPSPVPAESRECDRLTSANPESLASFTVPTGGFTISPIGDGSVEVRLSRFEPEGIGVPVGQVGPHEWDSLEIPGDAVGDRWNALVNGPAQVCEKT